MNNDSVNQKLKILEENQPFFVRLNNKRIE